MAKPYKETLKNRHKRRHTFTHAKKKKKKKEVRQSFELAASAISPQLIFPLPHFQS